MSIRQPHRTWTYKDLATGVALGVAISGAAQAQTSSGVNLYGIIDTTIRYS